MIIYDFYTDRTSGPIVNYLCTTIYNTKLIDYQLIEVDQDGVRNPDKNDIKSMAKLFTFASDGETFHILIDKDDDVKIGIGSRLSHILKIQTVSEKDMFRDNLVSHLTKVARDYKLKEIGL